MILQNLSPEIKEVTIKDLQTIVEIENECFSSPWPVESFKSEIEKLSWSVTYIAAIDESAAGFMLLWQINNEFHLQKIGVLKKFRNRGVAHSMITFIIEQAKRRSLSRILLEVRGTNSGALNLYKKNGFEIMDVRKGYYTDSGDDALVMELKIED
ncbi:MAG: ribosomal protein S18-alanine N-acetyltransferase [Deltaproteobacteria bacterium]|nr:ribosomal protein S18-alanine N-acetyltransferase [Deltaproteobacteria bacterium]